MSGDKLSKEAKARLQAMVATNDGFELSELDLKLRGAGDISGTQQSGLAFELKIANLGKDSQIVETARTAAQLVIDAMERFAPSDRVLLETIRNRYSYPKGQDFSMIS